MPTFPSQPMHRPYPSTILQRASDQPPCGGLANPQIPPIFYDLSPAQLVMPYPEVAPCSSTRSDQRARTPRSTGRGSIRAARDRAPVCRSASYALPPTVPHEDRKRDAEGQDVSARVDSGGRRTIQQTTPKKKHTLK